MFVGDISGDSLLMPHIRYHPKYEKKKVVKFYGMSSDTAMNKHHGGVAEYRSSEGRTVEIKYRGPVRDTVLDLLGGLRSACSYVGAQSLKQLSKCTTFIRVNRQINDVFTK
jgi:GMP reductase